MTSLSGCDDHGDHRPKHADRGCHRCWGPTSCTAWTKTFDWAIGVAADLLVYNTFDHDDIAAVDIEQPPATEERRQTVAGGGVLKFH